jgi:23S rRNA (uracil1939-C5)-methyltransferase
MKTGIVERIVNGGWGLVRSPEGIVFLTGVIPGETVEFEIKEKARGILWGRLLKIISSHHSRVKPVCPYYEECGGCCFQHIEYTFQQTIKTSIFLDDLKRIAGIERCIDRYVVSPPFEYRIRARMKPASNNCIGFIKKSTNHVLQINNCFLFNERINRFLTSWNNQKSPPFFYQYDILFNPDNEKLYVHLSHPPSLKTEIILKDYSDVVFTWKGNEQAGVSYIKIGNFKYLTSASLFFQNNFFMLENLLDLVRQYLCSHDTVIDLYSGVGFFLPLLYSHSKETIGVESSSFAVKLASMSFPEASLYNMPVEKFDFPPADIVLCDPPRSGLSNIVKKKIKDRNYKNIIYISCNSATFCRDLRFFLDFGYQIKDLNLIDLFPQTPHFEIVSNIILT